MWKHIALFSLVGLDLFLALTAIPGAIWVVPSQPVALLAGSPFTDYLIPALALGAIGAGALVAACTLVVRQRPGALMSAGAGAAIIVFELVETSVMGIDVWLHAVGLGPAVATERFGDLEGIPAPLGVPLPLWLQPLYILVGVSMIVLALTLKPVHIGRIHSVSLPVIRTLTTAYVLTVLVGVCLVISSVAGLLFGQRGLYEPDPSTLPSFLTQDAVSLVAGVPLLLGSMWTARRGSVRGLLLWMGMLFYIAYAYSYAVLGGRLAPLFLLYVAIVSMSLYCLVYMLVSTDADAVKARFSAHTPTTVAGAFVAFFALSLGSMWIWTIVGDLFAGTPATPVQLVVWPLDLIVAFPALFWGGIYLWRRNALGYVAGGIVLLKAAAEGLTLVLQSWVTALMGGPADPLVPVYAIVGMGGLVLLVAYLRGVGVPSPLNSYPSIDSRTNGVVPSPTRITHRAGVTGDRHPDTHAGAVAGSDQQ
jgi:hypothetical protein